MSADWFIPGLLGVLLAYSVNADIGYSEEELKALAKREQQALNAPLPPETQRTITNTQQSPDNRIIRDAQAQARYWQQKLSPGSLSGIIDPPPQKENPNAAPTGVMVFVSLSMPDSSLRALLRQSEVWQVPLVIRGVLPQGFPATAQRIQFLLQQGQQTPINSGFAISPEWFRTFNITEVPTFVAVKPGRCLPRQPCEVTDFDIVRGNVSLPDALEQLAEGDNPSVVKTVLNRRQP